MKAKNNELLIFDEPTNYMELTSNIDSKKWLKYIKYEMDFMYTNKVWTLVDPPEGIKYIGYKWVLKRKTNMDNNIQTCKPRLVTKCYRQRQLG